MILNGIKRIFLKKALRPVTPPPPPNLNKKIYAFLNLPYCRKGTCYRVALFMKKRKCILTSLLITMNQQ